MEYLNHQVVVFVENWHKSRLRNHLLFWLINVLISVGINLVSGESMGVAFIEKMIYLFPQAVASYFLAYYEIPYLLLSRRFIAFALVFIASTYVLTVMYRFLVVYVSEPILYPDMLQDSISDILFNSEAIVGQYFLLLYITPLFFVLLKYTKDVFLLSRKLKRIQEEKSNAEIKFLKAQVHPHFLFNTLNNIYTLTLKKSPKAAPASHTLAEILKYMTISGAAGLSKLEDEIQLIENYIELEKLRYGNRLSLSFSIDLDRNNYAINSLLLLPFVENAFKHGVSNDPGSPEMNVSIKVKNGMLEMVVDNTIIKNQTKDENSYREGIGIKNVKNQLDLLYPSVHTLRLEETPDRFIVKLSIFLKPKTSLSVFPKIAMT